MNITWIVLIVVFVVLVGFIVLQRRKPDEADKIASALDSAVKKAEDAVKDKLGKK